jgi:hypothetical protein
VEHALVAHAVDTLRLREHGIELRVVLGRHAIADPRHCFRGGRAARRILVIQRGANDLDDHLGVLAAMRVRDVISTEDSQPDDVQIRAGGSANGILPAQQLREELRIRRVELDERQRVGCRKQSRAQRGQLFDSAGGDG